jgi:hypothetical protein
MESTPNQLIIKAVFIFPLTKSLKVQHERLSKLPEKYEVVDVDNPIEAGQVLSMATCGIMFCSESKKILRCLEKYEKLFTDSKFRIILVLPKRIMGKEVADLNNRGVQDILVEPITEKALTTKVDFNFQMIVKLIDAAAKKAKRLEEMNKAREEAIALKKQQDEKRKQKQEEKLKQRKSDGFWEDKDKAAQALMFKPVEGKIKDGTENLDKMEDSAASLNALNLYNNSIEDFQKTLKEKAEEIQKKEEEEKSKKKVFDFDGPEKMDAHIDGDKKTNEGDNLDGDLKKKNGLILEDLGNNLKNKESGDQKLANDKLDDQEKQKKGLLLAEQDVALKTTQDNPSAVDDIEAKNKKNLANFQEQGITKNEAGKTKEQSDEISNKDKSQLAHFEEEALKNNTTGNGQTDQLADPLAKKGGLLLQNEDIKNKENSGTNSPADGIQNKDKNGLQGIGENLDPQLKSGNGLLGEHNEVNQKAATELNVGLDPTLQKGNATIGSEDHQNKSQGKGGLQTAEGGLNKNETKAFAENVENNSKNSNGHLENPIENQQVGKNGLEEVQDNLNKAKTAQKEHESNLDKAKSVGIIEEVEKNNQGKGLLEQVQKTEQAENHTKDSINDLEKAKAGMEFNGEIKKDIKYKDNFVDEFSKAKVEDKSDDLAVAIEEEKSKLGFSFNEIDKVAFDEAPKNVIRANLQALDIGIILLQKLSTSEQKIEEQSYIFPVISKKIYELFQGLISFYVMDSKGTPTLLHSSHVERKDFYASLKLPPIETHVTQNLPKWSQYRYSTLNDDTLHAETIELIYPFKEGPKMLGLAVVHCYRTLKETQDVSRLEMLIEFTRGYFLRFHNIGAQGKGGAKKSSQDAENAAPSGPWYKSYLDQFNSWLNAKKKDKTEEEAEAPSKAKDKKTGKVTPLTKKPISKKGAA